MTDKEATLFSSIRQPSNLRTSLVDNLIVQIESGDLAPGQRLPTEQAIMDATGVSRTVVREALATLRAKGLITTRQGLGAFVAENPSPPSFSVMPTSLESIDEVLRILELRVGIEAEAAGLAARRRTDEDLERMEEKLKALDAAIRNGSAGADEDFAFHRAILVATHNPYYARLIDAFGSAMIPKQWADPKTMSADERRENITRMRREHRSIFSAIRDRKETAASRALRTHLTRSAQRFTELRSHTGGEALRPRQSTG